MKSNQLSKTAAYIAIKFYGLTLTGSYYSLFDKQTIQFYDRLVANLPFPLNKYHTFLQDRWIRTCLKSLDEFFLPGDLMHIMMRKYYMSKLIDELVGQNYKQLIILGSGFDHLGTTFAEKGLQCFELDVPQMADLKLNFLKDFDYYHDNLTVFPAHFLNSSFYNLLKKIPNLGSGHKTMVVAEGFFDYLTPAELEYILKDLSNFFENRVTLISTLFALDELPYLNSLIFKSAVYAVGEKLKLHCSLQEFSHILKTQNFHVETIIPGKIMRKKILLPRGIEMPILPGFYLLKAHNKKSKNI